MFWRNLNFQGFTKTWLNLSHAASRQDEFHSTGNSNCFAKSSQEPRRCQNQDGCQAATAAEALSRRGVGDQLRTAAALSTFAMILAWLLASYWSTLSCRPLIGRNKIYWMVANVFNITFKSGKTGFSFTLLVASWSNCKLGTSYETPLFWQ